MALTTTLKLTEELKSRLAALAESEGRSLHAYLIESLEKQAERAERRRDYLAAGDAALADFRKTGIAYAMEDVERYIVALSSGKKAPRPKAAKARAKR